MNVLSSSPHVLAQFWILDPIYTVMGTALAWFYSIVPSYGLAIALLTISVRILLIPLTTKQVKSQQAMQRIQPELKRLQAKYKDDRQKLNEEMMKFYKENKVNPVAGCLPLLLQTPLFLVLYRLILGLTHHPEPKHLPSSSKLFGSLVESGGKMVSWGIDLAQSASAQKTFGDRWPYYVLVVLTVATGYYQQRQMTARMPAGAANAQMKMIGRVFPAMIGLISLSIPAGVVVYFIISNIWQIAQQEVTFRTLGPIGGPPGGSGGGGGGGSSAKESAKDAPDKGSAGSGKKSSSGSAGKGSSARKPPERKPLSALWKRPPAKPQGKPAAKPPPPRQTGRQQPKGKRPPPSPRPKGLPGPERPPERKAGPERPPERKAGPERPPERKAGPGTSPSNGQSDPSAKKSPPRKDG